MIVPGAAPSRMTDDQILAAYIDEGCNEEQAQAYLALVRDPTQLSMAID